MDQYKQKNQKGNKSHWWLWCHRTRLVLPPSQSYLAQQCNSLSLALWRLGGQVLFQTRLVNR